jgi:hypothetical protein
MLQNLADDHLRISKESALVSRHHITRRNDGFQKIELSARPFLKDTVKEEKSTAGTGYASK